MRREQAVETAAGMMQEQFAQTCIHLVARWLHRARHVVFTLRCQILDEITERFLSRCTQPHLRIGSATPKTVPAKGVWA